MQLYDEIMKKKVIIMDFDGTITDTETLHFFAWQNLFKQYGIEFTKQDFLEIVGLNLDDILKVMTNKYNEFSKDDFLKNLPDYLEYMKQLENSVSINMYDYVQKLLDEYKGKIFILSNQATILIDNLLNKWGVKDKFAKVISCLDENLTKVQVYDECENYFGVKSTECALFEDRQKYLDAGKARGMLTIGIQHEFNNIKSADFVIKV